MGTNRTDDGPLAAIVRKTAADRAITALKAADAYDSDRRIRPFDEDHLALPIRHRPASVAVERVVVQSDPSWRVRGLADRLRERGWTDDEIASVPSSWAVIGAVIVARFAGCRQPSAVGDALLDLHGDAHTVLDRRGISGAHREPDVTVVAGRGETETVHHEHRTAYGLDLAKLMFAPGNKAERVRMGDVVAPDETVFDMFAGIGYFTLPMARAGATVIAAERNPIAFEYLRENIDRNGVERRVRPRLVDCRELSPSVDRVVMGYYDAVAQLPTAIQAVRPGGHVHVHDVAPRDDRWSAVIGELEQRANAVGRAVELQSRRVVKSHSPGMDHVVVDATLA